MKPSKDSLKGSRLQDGARPNGLKVQGLGGEIQGAGGAQARKSPAFVQETRAGPFHSVSVRDYSHSMVPTGFGVRSYSTRFTPGTSLRMRSVMCWSRAKGTSSTVAVMASTVFTARMMTGKA